MSKPTLNELEKFIDELLEIYNDSENYIYHKVDYYPEYNYNPELLKDIQYKNPFINIFKKNENLLHSICPPDKIARSYYKGNQKGDKSYGYIDVFTNGYKRITFNKISDFLTQTQTNERGWIQDIIIHYSRMNNLKEIKSKNDLSKLVKARNKAKYYMFRLVSHLIIKLVEYIHSKEECIKYFDQTHSLFKKIVKFYDSVFDLDSKLMYQIDFNFLAILQNFGYPIDKKYFEKLVENFNQMNLEYKHCKISLQKIVLGFIEFDLINKINTGIIIDLIISSGKVRQAYFKKYPNKKFDFDDIIERHTAIKLETFLNFRYMNDEIKKKSRELLKKILTTNIYSTNFIERFVAFLTKSKYYTKQELVDMSTKNNSIKLLNVLLNLKKSTKDNLKDTKIAKKTIAQMFSKNAKPNDLKKPFCNYIAKNTEISLTGEEIMYLLSIKHPLIQALKLKSNYGIKGWGAEKDRKYKAIKKKLYDKFNVEGFLEMKKEEEKKKKTKDKDDNDELDEGVDEGDNDELDEDIDNSDSDNDYIRPVKKIRKKR